MTLILFGGFALMAVLTLFWIFMGGAHEMQQRAVRLLWITIVFLPVLSLLAHGRPLYNQAAQPWASPLALVVNPVQIFGGLLALIVCWVSLPRVQPRSRPLLWAISFYVLAQITSDLYNGTLSASIGPSVSLLVLAAVVMRGERLGPLKARITWMLRVYVGSSLLVYVVAPMWSVVPTIHASRDYFGLETRFIGLSAGPNYMAVVAGLSFFIEIYPLHRHRGWLLSAGCALSVCIWSQGRSAILILVVALAVAVGVQFKSQVRLVMATLVVLAVPCAVLLIPSIQSRVARGLSLNNIRELTTGRTEAWSLAWREFRQSPLVGRGSSVFGTEYWNDAGAGRAGSEFANAHNQFLQAMAQGGVVGLAATAILLGCLIRLAGSSARQTNGCSIAAAGIIVTQLAFGTPLRSTGFSVNLILLALCVGIMASMAKSSRIKSETLIPPIVRDRSGLVSANANSAR